jgi:hypothetical protein
VHGKLVKKDRPKPAAQQSAKELLQEITVSTYHFLVIVLYFILTGEKTFAGET